MQARCYLKAALQLLQNENNFKVSDRVDHSCSVIGVHGILFRFEKSNRLTFVFGVTENWK